MTRDLRNKARAVFLATLMVVSVFGGTMAFAGSAAAAVTGGSLNENLVQPGTDVTIENVDAYSDGNTLYVLAINETTDTVNASDQISDTAIDSSASWSYTFDPTNADLGLGDGDSFQIYIGEGGTDYSNAVKDVGSLTLDGTPVSFVDGDDSIPDSTYYTTSTPEIRQKLTDATSGVDDQTIQVTLRQDGDKYYSYEIGAQTTNDGVQYLDNNITIRPGVGDVPELEDGSYTAVLSATDNADNARQTQKLTFNVDTGAPTFELVEPTASEIGSPTHNIKVDVSDSSVASANITVTNKSGYSETFADDNAEVYSTGTPDQFIVDPSTDTTSQLPNGTIYVEVNATDTAGNYDETTYSFEVDNIKPDATNVELSTDQINSENDAGSETVTATFDEPVVPNTVDIAVRDGDGNTHTLTGTDDDPTTQVTLDFDITALDNTTNESAIVEVTGAEDSVANTLNNMSNTSFAIDTDEPNVQFDTMGDGDVISGYANITGNVTVGSNDDVDDIDSVNYHLLPGGDGNYDEADDRSDLESVSEPKNIDTTDYSDGVHTLVVYATDNVSNEDYTAKALTIDNNEPSLSYDQDATLTGEVDISTFLTVNNVGTEDVNYYYKYSGSDGDFNDGETFQDATTFDVNTVGEGKYILRAVANDPGFEGADASDNLDTVELDGKKLSLADPDPGVGNDEDDGFDLSVNGDTLTVNVTTDIELDRMNVTVKTHDNFRTQSSDVLELDDGDFTKVDSENGHKYVATSDDVDDLSAIVRDGEFKAIFEDASAADQRLDGEVTDTEEVDTTNATVTDADVVSADKDQLDVRVRFSEPVSSIGSVSDFNGHTVSKTNAGDDATDGVVNYTVEGMAQTGGDAELTFSDVTEQKGAPHTTDSTSADVTFSLELSEGVNVVSVPAETGEVPLDSLNLNGVNSIWEYNDGTWTKLVVEPDNGDLTSLKGGLGYIVNASEDTEIDYEVDNTPVTGVERNSEPVETGWNLVGHYQEGSQNVDQAFIGLTGVWGVEDYAGNQPQSLTLEQGYWLHTNTAGSHAPIAYAGPQSEQPDVYNVKATYSSANDEVTVSADVDDPKLTSVKVDASPFGAGTVDLALQPDSTYEATFNPTADTFDGKEASLRVTATDSEGNAGYSSDTVTVDNTIDTATLTDPGATVKDGESVTVDYNAQDTNFKDARIVLEDQSDNEALNTSVSAGDTSTQITAPDTADTYTVKLKVFDTAGNSKTAGTTGTITVTGPSITGASVTSTDGNDDGTYVSGETVQVTVNYDEAVTTSGTPKLDLGTNVAGDASYVSGSDSTDIVFEYTVQDGDDGSLSLGDITLNSGTMQDTAGNNADLTASAQSITASVDAVTPQDPSSISVQTTPPINSDTETSVDMDVSFSNAPEDGTVSLKVSDGSNSETFTTAANTAGTTTSFTGLDLSTLSDGQLTATAKIVDTAGNENPSGFTASTNFQKDTTLLSMQGADVDTDTTNNDQIIVSFDDNVDSSTVATTDFTVTDSNGDSLNVADASTSTSSVTLTIDDGSGNSVDLTGKASVTVTISDTTAVQDDAGNDVDSNANSATDSQTGTKGST